MNLGVFAHLFAARDAVRWVLDVHFTAQILPDFELGSVRAVELVECGTLACDPLSGLAVWTPLAGGGET